MRLHSCAGAGRQTGAALIIAMVLVVLIALTAATSMRIATSSEQAVNSLRLEALAQQYAEMGLRYCETELTKSDADIAPALTGKTSAAAAPLANASWRSTTTWNPVGRAAIVPAGIVSNANSSTFAPARRPECTIDKVTLPAGGEALLVTARGFSPGYVSDATTGETQGGAVVWLQSTVSTR